MGLLQLGDTDARGHHHGGESNRDRWWQRLSDYDAADAADAHAAWDDASAGPTGTHRARISLRYTRQLITAAVVGSGSGASHCGPCARAGRTRGGGVGCCAALTHIVRKRCGRVHAEILSHSSSSFRTRPCPGHVCHIYAFFVFSLLLSLRRGCTQAPEERLIPFYRPRSHYLPHFRHFLHHCCSRCWSYLLHIPAAIFDFADALQHLSAACSLHL